MLGGKRLTIRTSNRPSRWRDGRRGRGPRCLLRNGTDKGKEGVCLGHRGKDGRVDSTRRKRREREIEGRERGKERDEIMNVPFAPPAYVVGMVTHSPSSETR